MSQISAQALDLVDFANLHHYKTPAIHQAMSCYHPSDSWKCVFETEMSGRSFPDLLGLYISKPESWAWNEAALEVYQTLRQVDIRRQEE